MRFERCSGGGPSLRVQRAGHAGNVRSPHGRGEIVMNDREGAGVAVIDADLLIAELVLDQLILDAFVGQRPRRVETERLEVARQHLHRRDAARLDRLDELAACRERKVLAAPEPEALGVSEVMNRGGAGRRDVDDARVRQSMLQPKPGATLLRRCLVAALAFAARGVLHRVRLVEDDDPIEIGAQPFHDLFDPRYFFVAPV